MNKYIIRSICFNKLKGLNNANIVFSDTLTAIMGVNGAGKTTVIHALACLYQPDGRGENHRFPEFFVPNTDSLWNGSELNVVNENKNGDRTTLQKKKYSKDFDRWCPRYESRPKRNTYYIGIDTCLPDIEKKTKTSRIIYQSTQLTDKVSEKTTQIAAYILNKDYNALYDNIYNKTHFQGVELRGGLKYSSLSMGSGEQRVLKIISTILSAEAYSLILIDEIDLLLHVSALRRMIKKIYELAKDKHIQVVFTTHSLEMMTMTEYVKIQYIANCGEHGASLVYDKITTDLIYNMTGQSLKNNFVYVEDNLAKSIVKQLLRLKNLTASTEIVQFGSIENAFTIAASLVIENKKLDNCLVVLDGDKYLSDDDKEKQIAKKLSGNESDSDIKRKNALKIVTEFVLPDPLSPEKFIYNTIVRCIPQGNEIYNAAVDIRAVSDSHEWIYLICQRLDIDIDSVIREVFNFAYNDDAEFKSYISNVEKWLDDKCNQQLQLPLTM